MISDEYNYHYFQPDQLAMRVLHDKASLEPKELDPFWEWIGLAANKEVPNRRISIKPLDDRSDQKAVRHFTFPAPKDWGSKFQTYAFRDIASEGLLPEELPLIVQRINDTSEKLKNDAGRLDMLALNWLSAAGDWAGDGGPGGPPEPYPPEGSDPQKHIPHEYGDTVLDLHTKGHKGKGIAVVILDTAPAENDLKQAYTDWVTNAQGPKHPILKDLWADENDPKPLTIERMSLATKERLEKYQIKKHPYKISDHGTFIAGIVHNVAPDAKLYLYEALNEYGVCDGESILAGLDWIRREVSPKETRVVINCSLFLLIPFQPGQFDEGLQRYVPKQKPWDEDTFLQKWLEKQGRFSETTFSHFNTPDSQVVAAAGNDWEDGEDRPLARFPAAFASVVGVGALENGTDELVAKYSNVDDNPTSVGIAAFGGSKEPEKGVLGLYVSRTFPNPKDLSTPIQNEHGWARWAGTSFATPLVSGLVAVMMSRPGAGNGINVVQELRTVIAPEDLNTHEHVLKAHQH
jgi:hypothetical protein